MNNFTHEELSALSFSLTQNIFKYGIENTDPFYIALRDKIDSLILNDKGPHETEIHNNHIALSIDSNQEIPIGKDYLMPLFCELAFHFDNKIDSPGIYAFKLRLVKIE
jgi:hypothetical protein